MAHHWFRFEIVSKAVEPAYLIFKICCRVPNNKPYTLEENEMLKEQEQLTNNQSEAINQDAELEEE